MSDDLKAKIQGKYAHFIQEKVNGTEQKSSCCCSGQVTNNLYQTSDLDGLPEELAALSFGCGNPTALGNLYAGEVVLDLGSGAGLDVLLSAKRVGPTGKAYGLDMTDEMLAVARENQKKTGILNAEFLKGQIEAIPLDSESVDVVISNCVINLSSDKVKVMQEIARVLKPGGRIAISDIVRRKALPPKVQEHTLSWVGCMASALSEAEYRTKLHEAGLENVELVVTKEYDFADLAQENGMILSPEEIDLAKGAVVSAFIRAKKPAKLLKTGVDYTIRQADKNDFPAIRELLLTNNLPLIGVEKHIEKFIVAGQTDLIGVMGALHEASKGLIRSFAVVASSRKSGVGLALLQTMMEQLKQQGVKEIYLLTETARDYFKKAGFTETTRDEMPQNLLKESGLDQACPCSSYCLKFLL